MRMRGVGHVDKRLLHRRAIYADDLTCDGCASDALRREHWRTREERRPEA